MADELKFVKYSAIGSDRNINQDALDVLAVNDGMLFILCDGMGANQNSEIASILAIKSIKKYLESSNGLNSLELIKTCMNEANEYIYGSTAGKGINSEIATTMELLLLKDNSAYWGHIGDSRIYHLKNGKLKQLTKDHSFVQKLVDEGFITVKEAEHHPKRNILVKAMGEHKFVGADMSVLKLNEYDANRFFICSDGISSLLTNSEIEAIINMSNSENISENMSNAVHARGAFDDYSFIYIENVK